MLIFNNTLPHSHTEKYIHTSCVYVAEYIRWQTGEDATPSARISAVEGPNCLFHGTAVVAVRERSTALHLCNLYATNTIFVQSRK